MFLSRKFSNNCVPVVVGLILSIIVISPQMALAERISGRADPQGNVTWGGDMSDKNPIRDTVPPKSGGVNGDLAFTWTAGRFDPLSKKWEGHDNYNGYATTNDGQTEKVLKFHRPNDDTITDWVQIIGYGAGKTVVHGGNIKQESPWEFHPLSELTDSAWRIPDLAPFQGDPDLTIYTAVNLDLYISNNPFGFLNGNWEQGQTLDELGIEIVNGEVSGVAGIYWATGDFTFDPDSTTGWVPIGGAAAWLNSSDFQGMHGDIGILAVHQVIPEPTILTLLGVGILGLFASLSKRREMGSDLH